VTRAVVVASSSIARAGLETLLAKTGVIEVIGNVAHWSEYSGEEPDIVIADAETGAEELGAEAADAALPTIVLADDPRQPWLAEALRSGVRAVLPRESAAAQIIAAVDAVLAGLVVLQPGDLDGLLLSPRPATIAEPLTPREIEVLGMLAEGQSNKLIAHALGISEHTVKFHVNSVMTKLNAASRTEAVTLGIRQGLIMI